MKEEWVKAARQLPLPEEGRVDHADQVWLEEIIESLELIKLHPEKVPYDETESAVSGC